MDPNPYPLRSSDTKAPKRQNQTRIARRFFSVKKGRQNATNPRQHWSERDFSTKYPEKSRRGLAFGAICTEFPSAGPIAFGVSV